MQHPPDILRAIRRDGTVYIVCVRLRPLDSYRTSKSQKNPCQPTMGGAGLEPATPCL
jgi:hypothetical protein